MIEAACVNTQTASANVPAADKPQSGTSYYQLADSAQYHIAKEEWKESARCIREALRLEPANPGNAMLFANLGLAAGMEGKYGEAMQCFDIALGRAPKSVPVLTSKAKIQLISSDEEGALETIGTILATDSMAKWARETRGLLKLKHHDFKGAHDDFMLLYKKYPDDPWGPGGLAKCMDAQGYPAEAAGYYRDAIERCTRDNEDKVEFQLGLTEALGHLGQLQEAFDIVKEALSEHPHDGRLYLLRGWIKEKLLIYREAEADKKLALDYGVDPQTVEQYLPTRR